MFNRAFALSLILSTTSVTSAAVSECPRGAADRGYRTQTFRSAEDLKRFGTKAALLGVFTPNPLCALNDIAIRAEGQALRHDGEAFRGVYTLAAHACAAGSRAGVAATATRVCDLPNVVALFQLPAENGDRLLREVALQDALKSAATWVQTRPGHSPFMDARAAIASAELWTNRPVQAARALFTTFTCAEVTSPLVLNPCRLQRDVLALALNEALAPVAPKVTHALAQLNVSRRPEDAHLHALTQLADALDEISRLLGQGLPLAEIMGSAVPEVIDQHLMSAQVPAGDLARRAAGQATEELASLVKLLDELGTYRATYPEIALAQFARVRDSREMKAVAHALAERTNLLADVLLLYLNGELKLGGAGGVRVAQPIRFTLPDLGPAPN